MAAITGIPIKTFCERTRNLDLFEFQKEFSDPALVVEIPEDPWMKGKGSPCQTAECTTREIKKMLGRGEAYVFILRQTVSGKAIDRFSIGRDLKNDIVVPHSSLSRTHAFVICDPETLQCSVQDKGSANGTFFKNNRLEEGTPHPVRSQEAVMVGPFVRATFFLPGDFFAYVSFQRRLLTTRRSKDDS